MKKYFILSFVLLTVVSCSIIKKDVKTAQIPAFTLNNEIDSMNYALGMNVGHGFSNDLKTLPGGNIDKELIIKGFSESFRGDSTIMSLENAQSYFQNYINKAQAAERDLKKAEGEKFLAKNAQKEGVHITESGLQYIIQKEGNGKKPKATDKVKVHYTGTTIDGNIFDSSVQRGEPVEFPLNNVIAGWTEGVQLMNVGSKYKFFIPYNLAYGEQGIPQANIPPFAPLIFEVELLEIDSE